MHTILIRRRDCFLNYVGSKIAKRMDGYKVRSISTTKQRRLLLPLSLGVSSLTLLHVLDQQLHTQKERTGRTGYEIDVLIINESFEPSGEVFTKSVLMLKQKYPQYNFKTASLEEVYHYDDAFANEALVLSKNIVGGNVDCAANTFAARLQGTLAALPSQTSRADMIVILRTRLIVAFAKHIECESILWGDSTTRLAERTLAETAKGRGFSVPWQMADGRTPYCINFAFPMRDLLRKEINTYASLISPPLIALSVESRNQYQGPALSEGTTIDELMSQYFESVEQNYPSIVANVVRTSGRLQAASLSHASATCTICSMPIIHGTQGLHGWGGNQEEIIKTLDEDRTLDKNRGMICYGCSRTLGDTETIPSNKTI